MTLSHWTWRMGGKASRDKGNRFMQRTAVWLREVLRVGDFWKNVEETQQGNSNDLKDQSSDPFPLAVECKHQRTPSPWAALKQAEAGATKGHLPVAIIRRHGGEDMVCMRPDDWAVLVLCARLIWEEDPLPEVGATFAATVRGEAP